MFKYNLSKKAINDLKNIWNYTYEKWSEDQADKYYRMLIDSFNEILKSPESGKRYPIIFEELKGYKAGRHIIFYFEKPEGIIEIVRILHEQMDLKNRMKEK